MVLNPEQDNVAPPCLSTGHEPIIGRSALLHRWLISPVTGRQIQWRGLIVVRRWFYLPRLGTPKRDNALFAADSLLRLVWYLF
jgi:hypothetical protein